MNGAGGDLPADSRDDPLPGWAGIATLFGCAPRAPGAAVAGGWVAAGVPFDSTASSRPGAAAGPRAVRQASLVFASNLRSLGEHEMLDTRTGRAFRYRAPAIVDAGDLHVYPTSTQRTFEAVSAEARALLGPDGRGVFLNGDHSTTFATFAGYHAAQRERGHRRLGFVNVDHHFDFGAWSRLHGAIYHGSNSRRISELEGMRPEDVAFVGVGDVTRLDQYRDLVASGHPIVPGADIASRGAAAALGELVDRLGDGCDGVYVSLDVDVLDASVAPGTGHVSMGGLSAALLLDVFEMLRRLPIGALDVAEVSPAHDPSGRTAHIAARVLFEFLFRTGSRDSGLEPWELSRA